MTRQKLYYVFLYCSGGVEESDVLCALLWCLSMPAELRAAPKRTATASMFPFKAQTPRHIPYQDRTRREDGRPQTGSVLMGMGKALARILAHACGLTIKFMVPIRTVPVPNTLCPRSAV